MKKKRYPILIIAIMLFPLLILVNSCDDPSKKPMPEKCHVQIVNDSYSTLKYIYWKSELGSGVINIDVLKQTDVEFEIDSLPGTLFNFKIATINSGTEYVEWLNIQHTSGAQILFRIKVLEDCYLGTTVYSEGMSFRETPSNINTLPSI